MARTDAAVVALRLASHLAGFAADSVARAIGATGGIPHAIEGVDADWLTQALSPTTPHARVESVSRIGGHSGTTLRQRTRVTYLPSASPGASPSDAAAPRELPDTLFVKTTPAGWSTRLFGALFSLGHNEVRFYRDIRPDLPVLAPACYCARSAQRGGRFILLLEDLQARGARFATLETEVTLSDARAVIATLARLHAAFWESPRFGADLRWLKSGHHNPNAAVERFISARANEPAIARYRDVLPASVVREAWRIHEQRDQLEAYWAEGPQTLIHGDSHVGNMFFIEDEAGLLDWQVLQRGQGIRDVAYFMMNSLETELRVEHQEDLIDLYSRALHRHGVDASALDRDTTWQRYRSYSLYVFIAGAVTAATPGLQPESVARRGLLRAASAVDDLDAFGLLRGLS
jgi:aminoglycoside phosphotransferase (APT) family kinase protein